MVTSHSPFVRERCQRKEAQVELAAVTVALQGAPGAAGLGQPQVRVVDADGRPFAVGLTRDGFTGGEFVFTGAVCTEERLVLFGASEMYGRGPTQLVSLFVDRDGFSDHPIMFLHADARCEDPPLLYAIMRLVRSGVVYGGVA